VPGNQQKARVYLSTDNFNILDRQLQETYGETIADLNHQHTERVRRKIVLRKVDIPDLVVPQIIRTVVAKDLASQPLKFRKPTARRSGLQKAVYTVAHQHATDSVLRQVGQTVEIETVPEETDAYAAACDLAARYRLDIWTVYDELRRLYGADDIPLGHVELLAQQIEKQTRGYEVREETVDVALALIKPEGFTLEEIDGAEVYTAEIVYPKDKESLLLSWQIAKGDNSNDLGFHYDPYSFDSNPEKSFFEQMLTELNLAPDDIEDIYFTGATTDPEKTEFFVEYKDDKGKWRRYTPDFVIRKKPGRGRKRGTGRTYIVEIKREHDRSNAIDGAGGRKEMAIRKWVDLNPDRLRYEIIFTGTDAVPADKTRAVRQFIQEAEP